MSKISEEGKANQASQTESKFHTDQIIKNYKELCSILGLEYKTGSNSKKAVIKELERQCKHHKEGNKFVVDEVFSSIKPKVDLRQNNGKHNLKYDDWMDIAVINMIKNKYVNGFTMRFYEIFMEEIPLLTNCYKEINYEGYQEFADKKNFSKGLVLEYQRKAKSIIEKSFETSLNRFQKNEVLSWQKVIVFISPSQSESIAAKEEFKLLKSVEKEVYADMGISHTSRINSNVNMNFMKNVVHRYNKKMNGCRIIRYHYAYDIKIKDHNFINNYNKEMSNEIYNLASEMSVSTHTSVYNKKYKNKNVIRMDGTPDRFMPYKHLKYYKPLMQLRKMYWNLPQKDIDAIDHEIERFETEAEMYI